MFRNFHISISERHVDPPAPHEALTCRHPDDAHLTHSGRCLPRSDGPVIRVEKEALRAGVYELLNERIRRVKE